jgi:hypothetical protein
MWLGSPEPPVCFPCPWKEKAGSPREFEVHGLHPRMSIYPPLCRSGSLKIRKQRCAGFRGQRRKSFCRSFCMCMEGLPMPDHQGLKAYASQSRGCRARKLKQWNQIWDLPLGSAPNSLVIRLRRQLALSESVSQW